MHRELTPGSTASARVSRRSFLSMTAVGAFTLPASIARGAASQMSPQEVALVSAVSRHAMVSEKIDETNAAIDEIDASGMPKLTVSVRDVATRILDYPPDMLDLELETRGEISRRFGRHLASFSWLPTSANVLERIKSDFQSALHRLDQRKKAFAEWDASSGRLQLARMLDELYPEQDRLADEICELPCSSTRMAVIKANFGAELIDKYEMEVPGADLLSAILRSMLPLVEAET